MTSQTLPSQGGVVMSRSTIQKTTLRAVSVRLLIQCFNEGDTFIPRDIEGLFNNLNLHPARILDDVLSEDKSVTGHPVADEHMVRLIIVSIGRDSSIGRGYSGDGQQSGDQNSQTDYVLVC